LASGQYRVVLAMRSYGSTRVPTAAGRAIEFPASLEDLAPTLAEAFNLEPAQSFDGQSLLPALRGTMPSSAAERVRFMETEFNPPGLTPTPGDVMKASALLQGAKYYRVDPRTDRIALREHHLDKILANRQYGASRAGHLLASLPSGDGRMQHLVFAPADGAPARWLSGPPEADADPAAFELWTALAARFESVRTRPVAGAPPSERDDAED
jgi:hypothetical protein